MQQLPDEIRKLISESDKTQYQLAKDSEMPVNSLKRIKGKTWGTQILQAVKVLKALGYELIIRKVKK
jgi:cobalamin biosynthesis Co2+ chelatase CbiK